MRDVDSHRAENDAYPKLGSRRPSHGVGPVTHTTSPVTKPTPPRSTPSVANETRRRGRLNSALTPKASETPGLLERLSTAPRATLHRSRVWPYAGVPIATETAIARQSARCRVARSCGLGAQAIHFTDVMRVAV